MNKIKKYSSMLASLVIAASFSSLAAFPASAALTPTFILAPVNNNSQTQITVLGADPNASATLYYSVNNAYTSMSIGSTNATGYLTYTISPSSYNITPGGSSYIMIDGAQSQIQPWPAYTSSSVSTNSSGSVVLSQSNITMTVGQSTAVSVSSSNGSAVGTISSPANGNSSVASASVSGSQITVTGYTPGTTSITVCASNIGCTTLYVTVQSASSSSNTSNTSSNIISFSQNTFSMNVGQTQTVTLYGPGGYYVSSNPNPNVVSTNIGGSSLILTAVNTGTIALSVCASGNNTTSCGTINVTVVPSNTSTTASSNGSQGTISFSNSNVTLNLGQSQTVTVTGSGLGAYYISANSNSNIITANMTGNSISLYGNTTGGSNITVCQLGGVCGNVYAYVAQNGTAAPAVTTTSNQPLALTSFSVASNNINNVFMGAGVALTFTFSANQPLVNKSLSVGGQAVPLYGGGSGPYTGIYTMIGNEYQPLSVSISFASAYDSSGKATFSIGGANNQSTSVNTSPASTAPSSVGAYTFTRQLYVGSTGAEVTALQTRLTALGVYTGPITGTFGGLTEAAVKLYQSRHGLSQVGVVGPATRGLLNQGI